MRPLKVSTEVTVLIGPFVDKTDGVTEETGLAGADTEISKAGAGFGAGPVLGTHDSDGWYPITLTTTHTNTVGQLIVKVHAAATHLPVWEVFNVMAPVVYDSLFAAAGTDYLQVDTIQVGGTSQTGRDIGASVLLAADQAVNVTKWGGTAVASAYVQANTVQFAGQTITCPGGVTIPAATLASTTGAVGSVTAGVTLANGAHGGASASLTLGAGASISNASGSALTLYSSGGNGSGLGCTGNGTGKGIAATGGASGAGIAAVGGATANGYGIYAEANSADCYGLQAVGKGATESGGIKGTATTSGEGIEGLAAGNGHGLYLVGAGSGEGLHATAGGGANGHGAHFEGVGANSHGLLLSRGGAGGDDLSFANNDVTVATVTSVTGIGTGGIAAASFAAGAINAAAIATGAIDADAIADNAIDAAALASDVATEIATGILDLADGIETGYTLRQAQRVQLAAAAGKLSGAETTTVAIRNVTDAKTRITATVDADGNRSAVTLDAT